MDTVYRNDVIIHNVRRFPPYEEYEYGNIDTLSDYNLDNLCKLPIDECWYWYASGQWEGFGGIVMRKGELWDTDVLDHCSCYEPTDNVTFNGVTKESIMMSLGYRRHIEDLLEVAGWENVQEE